MLTKKKKKRKLCIEEMQSELSEFSQITVFTKEKKLLCQFINFIVRLKYNSP